MMREEALLGLALTLMIVACTPPPKGPSAAVAQPTSFIARHMWTAPDGSKHQAGREIDHYAQYRGEGSRSRAGCARDADCQARRGGVCVSSTTPNARRHTRCQYDECGAGRSCKGAAICLPAGIAFPIARCIEASCRSNADCRRGGRCRLMASSLVARSRRFGCVAPDDPCDLDRPCKAVKEADELRQRACVITPEGARCRVVPRPAP